MLDRDTLVGLVRLAQRGEAAACERLVRELLPASMAVALAITGRGADAEDVAQEALVSALEHIETCREPSRFAGWLLRIVRNHALNHLDKRRLREAGGGDGTATAAAARAATVDAARPEAAEEREQLTAALSVLSPVQREVVLLHDLEEWTHGEIAAALEISEVMSRQHLFQARRRLRAELIEMGYDEVKHEQG